MTARLDPAYRTAALEALGGTEFDVLVIGGGVGRAGARGAPGAQPALAQARPAPGAAGAVRVPLASPRLGARLRPRRGAALRQLRRRRRPSHAQAPLPPRDRRLGSGP